jgi:hypothetical protein
MLLSFGGGLMISVDDICKFKSLFGMTSNKKLTGYRIRGYDYAKISKMCVPFKDELMCAVWHPKRRALWPSLDDHSG